jgi:subtilisin-like proprotein convertase family protein
LNSFVGQDGTGVWILHEADNAVGFSDAVESFNSTIEPHQANNGITIFVTITNCQWYYDYIDVPPGATNLTITVTNLTPSPQLEYLYEKYGSAPTTNSFDKMATFTNVGTISIGPTDVPPLTAGRYFFGVYNPCGNETQSNSITTTIGYGVASQLNFSSVGATPILDDAVTYSTIDVPDNATISSVDVGLRVDHPRISDLVFHLISPDGTRVLLMENRGGTSASGCGASYSAEVTNVTISGEGLTTNVIDTGQTNGTLIIDYEFFPTNTPGEITVYYQGATNFDSPFSGFGTSPNILYAGTNTQVTVVINQGSGGESWGCIVNVLQSQYGYLVLTENTNLTTTPIKFAPPPFAFIATSVALVTGGIFNPYSGYYDYLLSPDTWTGSEAAAEAMGGHLVTIYNQSDNEWIYETFSNYAGTNDNLWWIGLYDPSQDSGCGGTLPNRGLCHSNNFVWVSGDTNSPYRNWSPGEPNNLGGQEFYTIMIGTTNGGFGTNMEWIDEDNTRSESGAPPLILVCGIAEVPSKFLPTLTDLYYLPEQSLDTFAGKNAGGTWTLEIQDDRAGATNPAPTLVSWQLRFTFANSTPVPTIIDTNAAFTNFIAPGGIAYYLVEVPTNASYATNILLFASAPVNVWFDTNTPPTITNLNDVLLLPNATYPSGTSGSALLITNGINGLPLLPPGLYGFYYLGVQNTNSVTVNYGLEVDFDNATGTWPLPLSIFSAAMTRGGAQLQWNASPDEKFQVEWATNFSQPMVWMTNADIITSSNGIFMFTDPGSTNSPARFYRLLQLP